MSFVSFQFLLFFPAVMLLSLIIPQKWNYILMAFTGLTFYALVDVKALPVLLLSIVVIYAAGRAVGEGYAKKNRRVVIVTALFHIALLVFFKYLDFIFGTIGIAAEDTFAAKLIEPAGLSFYALEAIAYIADCSAGKVKPERNFVRLTAFLSFFPNVLSGPIERAGHMLPQFKKGPVRSLKSTRDGLIMMLWGYFLKLVVASRLMTAVDTVYASPENYKGVFVTAAVILYSFEIYCDFAGYTSIAVGAAKVLGYDLMQNFNAPYLAGSVAEFWHRWHISLSTFLRDYIYIPLGGNRKGTARKYLNILIVFAVSGLWHGAAWTFVIWGMLHGIYQITGQLLKPVRDRIVQLLSINRKGPVHCFLKIAFTFGAVSFAWIFFRAGNFAEALSIIRSMGIDGMWRLTASEPFLFGMDRPNCILMFASLSVVIATDVLRYFGISTRKAVMGQRLWIRWPVMILLILMVVICGQWGPGYNAASFIYSQF